MSRTSWNVLGIGLLIPAVAGCTAILGDFSVGGGVGDSSANADESGISADAPADSDSRDATTGDTTQLPSDAGAGATDGEATVSSGNGDSAVDGGGATDACAASLVYCSGRCVLPTDIHNCGACAHDCARLANVDIAGLTCRGGQCVYQCLGGYADCADAGSGCGSSLSNSPNCGACGTSCTAASPLCAPTNDAGRSTCVSGCPSNAPMLCAGACVDEQTSANACGGCGAAYACGAGMACRAGKCVGPVLGLSPLQYGFSVTAVGASGSPQPFVVSNTGAGASAALATALVGANATDFAVAADGCNGHALDAGASCSVSIQFAPAGRGPKSASLEINGGQLFAALTGTGQDTVALAVTKSGTGGGTVSGDQIACGSACSEQVARASSSDPVIILTATPDDNSVFSGWSGSCSGTTPTCSVVMSQAQAANAKFDAIMVTLTVSARVFGPGSGSVASSPAGIRCAAPCKQSVSVAQGSSVTLNSTGGPLVWWGPQSACSGPTCSLVMGGAQDVTVTFVGNNFVFATSATHDAAIGGPAGGDALCNGAATAARLPGNYIAWLATPTINPATRLGTARGWLRTDGLPFADTLAGLAVGRVYYPPRLDELGQPSTTRFALTGAYEDGSVVVNSFNSAVLNCADFTTNSNAPLSYYAYGDPNGGSVGWTTTGFDVTSCGAPGALFCFGTASSNPVTLTRVAGRHAFVSKSLFLSGGGLASADALCQTDAANAGLANAAAFRAMLATNTASALSRFDTTKATWVRIDGVPVVTSAADLAGSSPPVAALSQYADGTYVSTVINVVTGARLPSAVDTTGTTCNNWTSSTSTDMAWIGEPVSTGPIWFGRLPETGICNQGNAVYCFEN